MTDSDLEHMQELATICATMFLDPEFDISEFASEGSQKNAENMCKVLAKTYIELQGRAGTKPVFRVKAGQEASR